MRRIAKKLLCTLTAALMMMSCSMGAYAFNFTPNAKNSDGTYSAYQLYSQAAYMINLDNGQAVLEVNSNDKMSPASMTKIMTAIVMLDYFDGDEDRLRNTVFNAVPEAFYDVYNTGAHTADIEEYEQVSCYDLLAALLVGSANEAANIIACGVSLNTYAFADYMNEMAAKIGMKNSHFSNAHGLYSDNNYTTCADMAKACKYALDKYPVFAELVGLHEYTMQPTDFHLEERTVTSMNSMLDESSAYYYPYCKGIMNGVLDESGRCLASYAEFNGERYLIVTMGAPIEKREEDIQKGEDYPNSVFARDSVGYNFLDHGALYQWAFNFLETTEMVADGETADVQVQREDGVVTTTLRAEHGLSLTLPKGTDISKVQKNIKYNDTIVAPIYTGDKLASLVVTYNSVPIEIPLVATEDIPLEAETESSESGDSSSKAAAPVQKGPSPITVILVTIISSTLIILILAIVLLKPWKKTGRRKKPVRKSPNAKRAVRPPQARRPAQGRNAPQTGNGRNKQQQRRPQPAKNDPQARRNAKPKK